MLTTVRLHASEHAACNCQVLKNQLPLRRRRNIDLPCQLIARPVGLAHCIPHHALWAIHALRSCTPFSITSRQGRAYVSNALAEGHFIRTCTRRTLHVRGADGAESELAVILPVVLPRSATITKRRCPHLFASRWGVVPALM